MIRFAIVGSGWRSLFYVRIAKAMPQQFEMVGMLCRTQEKASLMAREHGIYTTTSEQEILSLAPDFIVSAVSKQGMWDNCRHWLKMGLPVLSETPAALDETSLAQIRELVASGAKYQVAEQYCRYPEYSAMIEVLESGIIGEPVSLSISCMHDYHAVSVIRRLLKVEGEKVAITGKRFDFRVTDTRTRYEILTNGNVVNREQRHLIMEYESGKVAFYDFTSEQYRSPIRNRYINLRGTRGEIINHTVYYLDKDNKDCSCPLSMIRPYAVYGLNDDESAIVSILIGMKSYIEGGKEIYPVEYALEDACLAKRMTEAGEKGFVTI